MRNWVKGPELHIASSWGGSLLQGTCPEGAHFSCPLCPQLRQLEMQLEQEYEEKQMVLHEKQDLEGLIGTLCDQVRKREPPAGIWEHMPPPRAPAER